MLFDDHMAIISLVLDYHVFISHGIKVTIDFDQVFSCIPPTLVLLVY